MILLKISFLGTNYNGFQYQENGITIQQRLMEAARKLFGSPCKITGCSRTDAGVHANEYYCTLETSDGCNNIPLQNITHAMNRYLPHDITVHSVFYVSSDFNPRFLAKKKEYLYKIWNSKTRNSFLIDRAYHIDHPLYTEPMNKAAFNICGQHDFTSFAAIDKSRKSENNVRTVYSCDISKNDEFIDIFVCGDGFLYNMVRIIIGTLIYVSDGKIKPEDIPDIINRRDRKNAGPTVPAHGLYLNKVIY